MKIMQLSPWQVVCFMKPSSLGQLVKQEEEMVVIVTSIGVAIVFVGLALASAALNFIERRDGSRFHRYH